MSLGLAFVGGVVAGYIASRPIFDIPFKLFDDTENYIGVKFPPANHAESNEIEMMAVR